MFSVSIFIPYNSKKPQNSQFFTRMYFFSEIFYFFAGLDLCNK